MGNSGWSNTDAASPLLFALGGGCIPSKHRTSQQQDNNNHSNNKNRVPSACFLNAALAGAEGCLPLVLGSDKDTQPPALESALEIEREIELCKRSLSSPRLPPGLAGGSSSPLEQSESKFSVVCDGHRGNVILQAGAALLTPN